MPLDPIISQGITPIGANIPNVLAQIDQSNSMRSENALRGQQFQQNALNMQQQQQDRTKADEMEQAKKTFAQAEWGRNLLANSPPDVAKGVIAQNIPELQQGFEKVHGEGSWAAATPDIISQALTGAQAHAAAYLGIGPPKYDNVKLAAGEQLYRQSPEGVIGPTPIAAAPVKPPQKTLQHVMLGNGNIGRFDDQTGQVSDTGVKGQVPLYRAGYLPNGELDPKFEKQVQAILAYRAPPLPSSSRGPSADIMAEVYSRDPTYDGGTFKNKNAVIHAFQAGPDGKTMDAVNTAVQHLDQLKQLATALQNGDPQIINQAKQAWSRATGSPAPTNFEAVANVAAGEVNKVAVGGPGAGEDRELARAALSVKMSPGQIFEGIDNLQSLMAGRLNGMAVRYKNATKLDNFDKMLSPETADVLSRHGFSANDAAAPKAPPPASLPPTNAQGWALHQDAKGNKAYVSPDGKNFEPVQ